MDFCKKRPLALSVARGSFNCGLTFSRNSIINITLVTRKASCSVHDQSVNIENKYEFLMDIVSESFFLLIKTPRVAANAALSKHKCCVNWKLKNFLWSWRVPCLQITCVKCKMFTQARLCGLGKDGGIYLTSFSTRGGFLLVNNSQI